MRVSIVIPAYRPVALLSACLSAICRNTTLSDLEVIVVCNGSDEPSASTVIGTGAPFKLYWTEEAIGFTKAANIGFRLATGDFVVVLNTDAHLLDYAPKDQWLNRLLAPFADPTVGVTGLGFMGSRFGTYAPFYCTGIRRSLFDKIGYLDERFSPGYGEDADFCYRVRQAGFELVQVDNATPVADNSSTVTDFPIWHAGEQSFMDKEKRQMYVENGHRILEEKWGNV